MRRYPLTLDFDYLWGLGPWLSTKPILKSRHINRRVSRNREHNWSTGNRWNNNKTKFFFDFHFGLCQLDVVFVVFVVFLFIEYFSDEDSSLDLKTIGYYTLVSIPVAFTIFGLGYMIRTNCEIRKTCCKCCIDLEKEDRNLDYGTYYDHDGERRQDVMEVTFLFPSSITIDQYLSIHLLVSGVLKIWQF